MPCSSGRQPGQRIPKSWMMAARGSWLLHHLRRKALPMRENEKALFREIYLSHYHCHNHIHYHIHYHSPVATTGKTFDHWLRLVTTSFYRLEACFPYGLKHYCNASTSVIRLLLNTIHTSKTIAPQEHSYLYRHSTIIALHGEVDKGVIQQILAQVTLKR